jgi:hypothetical protein
VFDVGMTQCDISHHEDIIKNANENHMEKGHGKLAHGTNFNGKSQPR